MGKKNLLDVLKKPEKLAKKFFNEFLAQKIIRHNNNII